MSVLFGYLWSVILATGLALIVVLLSRPALRRLLIEVCGNAARADYWATFSGLFLVLCTLCGVLVAMPAADSRVGAEHAEVIAALSTLRAGVLGLLIASVCVAFVLLRSIVRFENRSVHRPPSWMAAHQAPPPASETTARASQ